MGSILQAAAQSTDGQPGGKDTLAFLRDFMVFQQGLERSTSEDKGHVSNEAQPQLPPLNPKPLNPRLPPSFEDTLLALGDEPL